MKLFRKKPKAAEPPQPALGAVRIRVEESGIAFEVYDTNYPYHYDVAWAEKARVPWSAVDALVASLMAGRTTRIKQLETELAGHLEQLRKRATP